MIDLDSFILKREGRSPAEIIEQDGEPAFRIKETEALLEVLESGESRVIALGGGAWTIEANRAVISQHQLPSVWLDAPFEVCWDRITAGNDTVRPLAPNRACAERLYDSRRASYRLANLQITADRASAPLELVSLILSALAERH